MRSCNATLGPPRTSISDDAAPRARPAAAAATARSAAAAASVAWSRAVLSDAGQSSSSTHSAPCAAAKRAAASAAASTSASRVSSADVHSAAAPGQRASDAARKGRVAATLDGRGCTANARSKMNASLSLRKRRCGAGARQRSAGVQPGALNAKRKTRQSGASAAFLRCAKTQARAQRARTPRAAAGGTVRTAERPSSSMQRKRHAPHCRPRRGQRGLLRRSCARAPHALRHRCTARGIARAAVAQPVGKRR